MNKFFRLICITLLSFSLCGGIISTSTTAHADTLNHHEATIMRDRGVCGDMNKNSATYRRYCLKDSSASAGLTQAQVNCIWALFRVAISPGRG